MPPPKCPHIGEKGHPHGSHVWRTHLEGWYHALTNLRADGSKHHFVLGGEGSAFSDAHVCVSLVLTIHSVTEGQSGSEIKIPLPIHPCREPLRPLPMSSHFYLATLAATSMITTFSALS